MQAPENRRRHPRFPIRLRSGLWLNNHRIAGSLVVISASGAVFQPDTPHSLVRENVVGIDYGDENSITGIVVHTTEHLLAIEFLSIVETLVTRLQDLSTCELGNANLLDD